MLDEDYVRKLKYRLMQNFEELKDEEKESTEREIEDKDIEVDDIKMEKELKRMSDFSKNQDILDNMDI